MTTIALLNCSISWCQNENNAIPSTGVLTNATPDSVLVSYDDLRKANAKMVELKYEKEINDSLQSIISNDDKIIREYDYRTAVLKKQLSEVKRQRNYIIGGGVIATLVLVIGLLVK